MNPVETDRYAAESETLHTRFVRSSARSEPRKAARQYFRGLLAPVQRKNYWQMAEVVGEKDRQAMQRLLFSALWDADAVRDELQDFVIERLGVEDRIGVVDETGFPKKGYKSAGVRRQYCATAGKIAELCRGRSVFHKHPILPLDGPLVHERKQQE